jgi:chromosome segregation and condensation protein ScpB
MPSNPDMTVFHARLLEAILFIAERPVSLEEIKQKLLINEEEIAKLIALLEQNLKARNSFVELVKLGHKKGIRCISHEKELIERPDENISIYSIGATD